jgi:hypothetical protein
MNHVPRRLELSWTSSCQVHEQCRRLASPALFLPNPFELWLVMMVLLVVAILDGQDRFRSLLADVLGVLPKGILLPLRNPPLYKNVFRILDTMLVECSGGIGGLLRPP